MIIFFCIILNIIMSSILAQIKTLYVDYRYAKVPLRARKRPIVERLSKNRARALTCSSTKSEDAIY